MAAAKADLMGVSLEDMDYEEVLKKVPVCIHLPNVQSFHLNYDSKDEEVTNVVMTYGVEYPLDIPYEDFKAIYTAEVGFQVVEGHKHPTQ